MTASLFTTGPAASANDGAKVSTVDINGNQLSNCLDSDNDGIANHLDLDSDGDGCYDSFEAGVIGATNDGSPADSLAIVTTDTTGVGANGFANVLETTTEGVYDGTYTYDIATNADNNQCEDNDMDGVSDYTDIDDDNDGILDSLECQNTKITALSGLFVNGTSYTCLLYTSPSPRDRTRSRMPSSA